jgi:hypothetical protein
MARDEQTVVADARDCGSFCPCLSAKEMVDAPLAAENIEVCLEAPSHERGPLFSMPPIRVVMDML